MIDKIRPRKLNATADSRLRKADEMQDAINLVSSNDFRASGDTTAGNDGTGNAGVLKPARGTAPINFSTDYIPSNTKRRVLGSVTDHSHNVVYFFVWCENQEFHGVYAYDPDGYLPGSQQGVETCVKVFTHPLFNFPSNGFIKADIVHLNKPFEDYDSQPVLYFTDNKNEPRKLQPFRALTEDFSEYGLVDVNDFITACSKTPIMPIEAQFGRDVEDASTSFEGLPGFQFAYQHLYKGGEESALSTFSDIAVPQAYYNQGSSNSADLYANNKCVLTIPSAILHENGQVEKIRTLEVSEVRILRRIGNNGAWVVVDEVTVKELESNGNEYNFYNRSISGGFPSQTAMKPYDNLPQKAEAQAVVSDRLMYGNYVEGYDNVKVTASATVNYHERPEDFKELEVRVVPTIRKVSEDAGAVTNKRAGYYLDTTLFPGLVDAGSIIQFDFSVKPNRNFHIYNSENSFHGSRHLSISDAEDAEYPKVKGDTAEPNETRVNGTLNQNLDRMFGANQGVSVPELKWQCTDSQDTEAYGEHEVVFGTSAANPFILRGSSLHFSVKIKAKADISDAATKLKTIFTDLLSGETLSDSNQNLVEILGQNNVAKYQINEGIDGGGTFTTPEESISSSHEIPVASGGDDRKHLIVALGKKEIVDPSATDLKHQSPCGYFIVNKAEVGFGLNRISDGFLELDLREMSNVDILTAIPFINAERWKDEAYEHNADGVEADDTGVNDSRNWGLRDATIWSLDSLIIDSWFCYSREFLQSANLHPKVFTPTPTDFPRYMNGSDTETTGLSFGDLNEPEVTGDGQGKNAAILNMNANVLSDLFLDASGNNINTNYRMRWNANLISFRQSNYLPYLQATTIKDSGSMINNWPNGRHLIVGFLSNDDVYDFDAGEKFSILDGAIGPGGAPDGGENIRKVQGGGTNYAVGSITGEMVFAGRLAPRGFIRPEAFKAGKRQTILTTSPAGYDDWFHQYGLGPVLPYYGGVGYQKKFDESAAISGVAGDVGYINNFLYRGSDGPSNAAEMIEYSYVDHFDTTVYDDLSADYLGDVTHEDEWDIVNVEADVEASSAVGDAEILLTGREFSIFGGGDWIAGGRSFKTKASHTFGIVYYDERGRSGKVNPILFSSDEDLASPGIYVKGYGNSERDEKGRVSIKLDLSAQTPPEWAFNYQIMYGGNTTTSNFIQYSTGGAFISNKNTSEEGVEEVEDQSSTNIYVSLNYLQGNKDVSYSEAFGAVSPLGSKQLYTYKPGDKLRVLAHYTDLTTRKWVEDVEFEIIGVESVSNNPETNIFRRAFELDEDNNVVADCRTGQFLVLKNNTKAEGFNYSSVKAGGNQAQTTAHNWNNVCTVEIYSPSKEIDAEGMLFYETGQVYSIAKDTEGNLSHFPSVITLSKGDVWFKPVALASAEWGEEAQDVEGNSLDSYLKFKNLIRKGIDEGESSPRFKNYYVESMTFNDTFAGNNVLGIGKPNNVDKDILQIRKPSSIIYSDKQDFSKRGLKLTSFNGTASNWKDLPGEYGSINYLINNYDSLMCIQENKASNIPVERNVISDASGSNTLVTSNKVVGVQAFYAGEYGCDNNPESVVKNDEAVYFASKSKSEVYRLTSQGISVISKEGMESYFFRVFEEAKQREKSGGGKIYIPGGYDPLKDEFLITVSNLKEIPRILGGSFSSMINGIEQGGWGETIGVPEEEEDVVISSDYNICDYIVKDDGVWGIWGNSLPLVLDEYGENSLEFADVLDNIGNGAISLSCPIPADDEGGTGFEEGGGVGCTDPNANNYDPQATQDDGSCLY